MTDSNLEEITEATTKGNYKVIGRLVRKARRQGNSDEDVINALSVGLTDVSEKYKTKGMYLDDIIKAAGAFEVGIQSLGLKEESKEPEKKNCFGCNGRSMDNWYEYYCCQFKSSWF